jgi:hypothetical protein
MLQDREHLDLARRHLADAKLRIDGQRRLIERLRVGGHPTALAEQLLVSLLETEVEMRRHRDYLWAKIRAG